MVGPQCIGVDVEENVGVRQQRILEADESGAEVARGEQAYIQWKEGRTAAITQASRPSITVQIVTAFAAGTGFSAPELAHVQIETVSRAGIERPGGRRFGALVHAVLAAVNLDASPDEIGEVAEANGRLIGAAREEIDAAVATVGAALKHPILQRATKALAVRRETPLLDPPPGPGLDLQIPRIGDSVLKQTSGHGKPVIISCVRQQMSMFSRCAHERFSNISK